MNIGARYKPPKVCMVYLAHLEQYIGIANMASKVSEY